MSCGSDFIEDITNREESPSVNSDQDQEWEDDVEDGSMEVNYLTTRDLNIL
jgi:hypothetical protein